MDYIFFISIINEVLAFSTNMTIRIDAGQAGCFYHNVSQDEVIFVEYNVIDSTLGDLYVNFHLTDPEGEIIVADFMRSENEHTYTVVHDGIHRLCFDNTITNYNEKTVSFEMQIKNKQENVHEHDNEDEEVQLGEGEDMYIMRLRDICESVSRIQANINAAQQLQKHLSAREARDKRLMEDMQHRVSSWSKLIIILIMFLGIAQVSIVKNLFKDTPMKLCNPDLKISTAD